MNVELICVGKIKEACLREAVDEYAKRLGRFCRFKITELADRRIPENASAAEERAVLEAEGADILRTLGKGYTVALCVEGKELSSEELAAKLADVSQRASAVNFVIGGSLGLSDAVKERADLRLSLGRITLPHRLARLVLAEQIYRCYKINANETYHK